MSLQQLLIFLLLAHSVFCLITQNDSERCSEEQLEHFLKQQYLSSSDSGGGYRLIVKENLKVHSAATMLTSKERYFIDKDQMVQYQGISQLKRDCIFAMTIIIMDLLISYPQCVHGLNFNLYNIII